MKHLVALLLGLLLATGPSGQAQRRAKEPGKGAPAPAPPPAPVQTARTELPLTRSASEVYVQPLAADSSVLLLLGRDRRNSSRTDFAFQRYDQHLRLSWERPVEVPDEFHFTRLCAEASTVYALFSSDRVPGRLFVAACHGPSQQLRTQAFETKLSRDIVELKAMDGRLFATVLLADGQHVTALLLEVATGRLQYLSAVYEPLPAQFTFVANAAAQRAQYVVSQNNGRKARLQLKELTDRGQLLRSEFVQAESERSLITAQLSPPQDTSARLLAGTYSLRDPRYAQGLFATDLRSGPRAPLRFYDFLHLKHFFDFLKPARQARLRQRIAKRAARAVPPLRWHYRLLLHEMQPAPDGGYVLVAEVYYPHYRYSGYGGGSLGLAMGNPGMPYGLGFPNSRIFDGYRTTHVLVCGFDASGSLLWDNVYVLDDTVLHYDLEESVRMVSLPDGRLVLAYLFDGKVHYKYIDHAETSTNDLAVPIQTSAPGIVEKVSETSRADLQPWYGSRFLAFGYQDIRPAHGEDRNVFFLNEVAF